MLLAYLCLLSSLFLIYLPLFVLWSIKSMTWNEFVFSYPSLRWIKPTHDIVYTIIFIPLIGISFYTSFNQDKFGEDFFLLFTPLVNVILLFHGILAFKTSVYIFSDNDTYNNIGMMNIKLNYGLQNYKFF